MRLKRLTPVCAANVEKIVAATLDYCNVQLIWESGAVADLQFETAEMARAEYQAIICLINDEKN